MLTNILLKSAWITPQIDFLLWLQNIRANSPQFINNIFLCITMFGEFLIPILISSIVYWSIDYKKGSYLLLLCGFNIYFAQILKMIACIYRPWVLSNKIIPLKTSIIKAAGYSFPSGHTAMATSAWGGMAYLLKKYTTVCVSLILLVLLVGFSRLYLGVHTPQDVITSMLLGITLIFSLYPLINWCNKSKNRYLKLLVIYNVITIAILYFICTKNYPIDYLNDKILVNPQKAIYNSIVCYGMVSGIVNGIFLANRFLDFEKLNNNIKSRIVRAIIGTIITGALFTSILENIFFPQIHDYKITFTSVFFVGFFITYIYPYFCILFTNKTK